MRKVDPYNCCENNSEWKDGAWITPVSDLDEALGGSFTTLFEYLSSEGYGHHTYYGVYGVGGRYIVAECGGCSCEGSGSWSWYDSLAEAWQHIPEYYRESDTDSRIKYSLNRETNTIEVEKDEE